MPNNKLDEFIRRLTTLENKVDFHLNDGITVKTDIATQKANIVWLTKAYWVLAASAATGAVSVLVFVVQRILSKH